MLIQIAFFVVMLVGLAALYIDLGSARLTQSMMQNAVDTASLEGLRTGDRSAARDRVTDTFADPAGDADPALARNMGLGAFISFGSQRAEFADTNASQCYNPSLDQWTRCESNVDPLPLPASGFYRPGAGSPQLELNPTDKRWGDMVAGTYDPAQNHAEQNCYQRDDFTAGAGSSGFLVRLRRTDRPEACDEDPGVSSHGPSVPLLFGRGVLTFDGEPRRTGLTVRATAIADARRALRVGAGSAAVAAGLPVAAPIALDNCFWQALPNGTAVVLEYDAGGTLTQAPAPPGCPIAGHYLNETTGILTTVGDHPINFQQPTGVNGSGFAAVYTDINGTTRVVGFGSITWIYQISPGTGNLAISVTRQASSVQPNTTAHIAGNVPALTSADWNLIRAANAALAEPVLAPIIVR